MQMARDLRNGLAAATNSLSTRLMAGLAGQASPPVSGEEFEASEVQTHPSPVHASSSR